MSLIKTSDVDVREYRYHELPNRLRVVLVSDPSSHYAAASMSVGVGNYQDPESTPGLAHFLEHMLFMGTKEYPDENDYQEFLSSHGGYSNAYTDDEYTNYFFTVHDDSFEPALDRFSKFFINPLMKKDSVEREMKAVNAEHEKNINNDGWREHEITGKLFKKDHPITKFGTGNLKTLSHPGIHDELTRFYEKYYSANRMCLCVYGSESLDELQEMVTRLFSPVIDRSLPENTIPKKVFIEEKQLQFVSVQEENHLTLCWIIPNLRKLYFLNIIDFITHLLGHESEGSIFWNLKKQQLISSLIAGESRTDSASSLLSLDFSLSEKGMKSIPTIIHTVEEYIRMLRETLLLLPEMYKELQTISHLSFRYLSRSDPIDYVVSLSQNMQKYPVEDIIYAPFRHDDYSETHHQLLDKILSGLTREKMRMTLSSSSFEDGDESDFLTEEWYGIKYRFRPLPLIEKIPAAVKLPEMNPFMPDPELVLATHLTTPPIFIPTVKSHSLWCRFDNSFKQPIVIGMIVLQSDQITSTPTNVVAVSMLQRLLTHQINYLNYYALQAGMRCRISYSQTAFIIDWSSYRQQYRPLIELIWKRLSDLKFEPELYQQEYENLLRDLKNLRFDPPYHQANDLFANHFIKGAYRAEERYQAALKLTQDDVLAIGRHLVTQGKPTTILVGDVESDEFEFFDNLLTQETASEHCNQIEEYRIVKDVSEPWRLTEKTLHADEKNSAIIQEYRVGYIKPGVTPGWNRLRAGLDLVEMFLDEPFFDQLRTKEQLGYLVKCYQDRYGRPEYQMNSLRLMIQSPNHTPEYLSGRIDEFMKKQEKRLDELTLDEFKKMAQSLAKKYHEDDQTLMERFSATVAQIIGSHYLFDFKKIMEKTFQEISLDDFKQMYRQWIIEKPMVGRVEIIGQKNEK